jgi:uncharacterized phage protein gp47/JayE
VSLPIPTTSDLNTQIVNQLAGSLGQSIPFLPKAFLRVLAKVLAGCFVLLYKYCGFLFLQLFVAYASDKETTVLGRKLIPLVEWGRLVGVGDPDPATRAELWINATVLAIDASKSIAAGQQLTRTETGFIYTVVAPVALSASPIAIRIRATSSPKGGDGSGTTGNLQPDDIVEFANTPPGVATKATVTSQAVTAADAETTDRYRGRIVEHMQAPPQGGAYADYREWAEDVAGIVNAYPYAGLPGQVNVYVEADEASSGSPDGVPTGPQLTAVFNSIQLNDAGTGKATRRPVSAAVNVLAITRHPFDVQISALSPDTTETRIAIREGVDEQLRSLEPFIVGLSSLPRKDRVTQSAISGVVDAIASAKGATISSVALLIGGVPKPAYTLLAGEKAKLNGDPTYV